MSNMNHFRRNKRTRIKTTIAEVTREQIISPNKLRKLDKIISIRERLKTASRISERSQFALLATRSMLVSAGRTIQNALVVES